MKWSTARELEKKLTSLLLTSSHLFQTQSLINIPTLDAYIAHPTPSNWDDVKQRLSDTLVLVDKVASILSADEDKVVVYEFYDTLSLTIKARDLALRKALTLPPPTTDEQLQEFGQFLLKYQTLVVQLDDMNTAIRKYVQMLKSGGKWPIKGD